MKATLRIPTREQYGYYEIETEVSSFVDAAEKYIEAMKAYKEKTPVSTSKLPDKSLEDLPF